MKRILCLAILCIAGMARADILDNLKDQAADKAKAGAKGAAQKAVVDKVNKKLLEEGRKNQCSFKTGTDALEGGCDKKLKTLASDLVDAKKVLAQNGVGGFKFEVSGHTDSTGDAQKNKELSERRAAVIVKELVARGVPHGEIIAVGYGSERRLVKPDDTDAKKAKNRRYEIQVRL